MDFEVAGVYDKIARNCGKIWKNSRKFWEIWGENYKSFDKTYRKLSQIAGIFCNYRRYGNPGIRLKKLLHFLTTKNKSSKFRILF
jgi:hypothetical protein